MQICSYCKKEIGIKNSKGKIPTLTGHINNCNVRKKQISKILTPEFLQKHLIDLGYSANYVALSVLKQFNAGLIIKYAKQCGIETRDIKKSNAMYHVVNQRRLTCMEKYGVENPSQSKKIKNKKRKKSLLVYGCENVFQSEVIKEKSKKTCIEKYGVPNWNQSAEGASTRGFSGRRSNPHIKIEEYLCELGVEFFSEAGGIFGKYNEILEKFYCPIPDIVVKDKKIVIEIYGDFWHANPKVYKPNDKIPVWDGPKTSKRIWIEDEIRIKHIESFGFKVFIFWQSEIDQNWKLVKNKVKEFINEN